MQFSSYRKYHVICRLYTYRRYTFFITLWCFILNGARLPVTLQRHCCYVYYREEMTDLLLLLRCKVNHFSLSVGVVFPVLISEITIKISLRAYLSGFAPSDDCRLVSPSTAKHRLMGTGERRKTAKVLEILDSLLLAFGIVCNKLVRLRSPYNMRP